MKILQYNNDNKNNKDKKLNNIKVTFMAYDKKEIPIHFYLLIIFLLRPSKCKQFFIVNYCTSIFYFLLCEYVHTHIHVNTYIHT